MRVINPYADSKLTSANHKKSELHVHIITDENDEGHGWDESMGTEEEMAQEIEALGYDIYARTAKDQILALQSNNIHLLEPSQESTHGTEHTTIFFSDTIGGSYAGYNNQGALMFRAHPNDLSRPKYTYEEILSQFNRYGNLLGIEVCQRNSSEQIIDGELRRGFVQYLRSSEMWDKLLRDTPARRNIYGISTNDAYNLDGLETVSEHYNNGWTDIIIEGDITNNKIYDALKKGCFFFVSYMDKLASVPLVTDIEVNGLDISITIDGSYDEVYWISGNEVVGTGTSHTADPSKGYVRFEIWTSPSDYWPDKHVPEDPLDSSYYDTNIVGSQPFLFYNINRLVYMMRYL